MNDSREAAIWQSGGGSDAPPGIERYDIAHLADDGVGLLAEVNRPLIDCLKTL